MGFDLEDMSIKVLSSSRTRRSSGKCQNGFLGYLNPKKLKNLKPGSPGIFHSKPQIILHNYLLSGYKMLEFSGFQVSGNPQNLYKLKKPESKFTLC